MYVVRIVIVWFLLRSNRYYYINRLFFEGTWQDSGNVGINQDLISGEIHTYTQ